MGVAQFWDLIKKIGDIFNTVKKYFSAASRAKIDLQLQEIYSEQAKVAQASFETEQQNIALQQKIANLEEQIINLQKENTRLTEWNQDKHNYQEMMVAEGAFVYVKKTSHESCITSTEPEYWLCPVCYEQCRKSILQNAGIYGTERIYKCYSPGCSFEVREYVPVAAVRSRPKKNQIVDISKF
ncbi:TPA: hypothetical protein RUU14_001538 [Escherichia coli]|nr:hypothetical protein [Escherichia coli]